MKNLGSILAFIAASVALISARALPTEQSLDPRYVGSLDDTAEIEQRAHKKVVTEVMDAGPTKTAVAATATATASSVAGKKGKGGGAGKGKNGNKGTTPPGNLTSVATNCTGKAGNGMAAALNVTAGVKNTTTSPLSAASSAAAKKGGKSKGGNKGKGSKVGGGAANATIVDCGKAKISGAASASASASASKKKGKATTKGMAPSHSERSAVVQALAPFLG